MKSLIKKYSDSNPEKFNSEFIWSRDKGDILSYVTDIFKSLEVIPEIKVESVTLDNDEASFGPIKNQHKYYKSILESRLSKIHYKIKITPSDDENSQPYNIEGDLFINKLIDNCFYINEGVRYYLIYQIVDNATYGTSDMISLKSLLMPITVKRQEFLAEPEFLKPSKDLFSYDVLLFSKKVNPIMYVMSINAFNSLENMKIKNKDRIVDEWQKHTDPTIIDKFNEFFNTDFKFSDNLEDFAKDDDRTVFQVKSDGKKKETGVYISVSTDKLENDKMTQSILGCLLNVKMDLKKKLIFTYNDVISPWFWVEKMTQFFTKNNDPNKKMDKMRTMLISLNRLIDDSTRKVLEINDDDKKDTLSVIKYMIREFDELSLMDGQDLENKRLRLYEYQFYPLRQYFSAHIYTVLNSPTRSKTILDRVFSNLNPMYIIKQTVTNELLRYYNAPNEINLYTSLLKYTFRGPQSLTKTVSMAQRDVHPSYAGRLSLIAASSSDPGLSGCLVPFVKIYDNYYFKKK